MSKYPLFVKVFVPKFIEEDENCPDTNVYCGDLVPRQNYKDHLFVNSVKLIVDGALGSWGALMIEPYDDQPTLAGIQRLTANGSIPNLISKV